VSVTDKAKTRQALDHRGDAMAAGVARDLSELARELQAETSSDAVMQRIVDVAASSIPGAAGAAITLFEHGRITSPAHSDDHARSVGLAQEETGEGPCVETSRDRLTLRSDDLDAEQRWPKWAAAARANGVRSAMSFQLFVEQDSMGALDVYADEPNAFDDDAENIGLLLASHAAVALADTRKMENLDIAISSRDVIGQAKGILMERYKIGAQQAFDLLVYASQQTHRKLRDICLDLATTGELPSR
jgi:transcriptional regulator with GAF, ATPase, and Fis domain